MAISSVVSRFQASAASIAVLEAGELAGGLVGVVGGQLVEAVEHVAELAHAVLDVAAHVLVRVELGLLLEQADGGAGRELGVAAEVGVLPGHDAQQGRLAGAVRRRARRSSPREEGQRDVLEHPLVGRVDPGKLVHGEDVLRRHERPRIESRPWDRRSQPLSSLARTASATGRRCGPASTCSRGCCASRASTSDRRSFGLEIELNLTDEAGDPAMVNARALEAIADADFQTEIGQFNIEINVPPRLLEGDGVHASSRRPSGASLNRAEERARTVGAHMMVIGILPTVAGGAPDAPRLQRGARATQLAERADLRGPRRGPGDLDQRGGAAGDLRRHDRARGGVHERAAAPAGGARRAFASHWNAAQAIAAAAGGRGRELAVLLRPRAVARDAHRAVRAGHRHAARGAEGPGRAPARLVRRALDHLDLRPVRGERALLPGAAAGVRRRRTRSRCSSAATRRRWPSCSSTTGRSTAGTGRSTTTVRERPHLRVENRLLPAGPTVVDICANAAFYYGLVRALVAEERPLWTRMSFSAAEENFHAAARDGIEARVYWPGVGEVPVSELVLRRLLPAAHAGLEDAGVDAADRDRLLGHHRAPLRDDAERRGLAGGDLPQALRGREAGPPGGAAADDGALPRPHARRTSRCTSGRWRSALQVLPRDSPTSSARSTAGALLLMRHCATSSCPKSARGGS